MRKASTRLLEQGIQAPSPAPDLIPAETKTSTENLHWDWYSKRGHFRSTASSFTRSETNTLKNSVCRIRCVVQLVDSTVWGSNQTLRMASQKHKHVDLLGGPV